MAQIKPKSTTKITKTVKATPDSTKYFKDKAVKAISDRGITRNLNIMKKATPAQRKSDDLKAVTVISEANQNRLRQANKGKKGFDKNGYKLK